MAYSAAIMQEYQRARAARQKAVRENAGRRMCNPPLPPVPVPPKPERPMWRVAYAADGTYEGRLHDDDDVPADCTVHLEPAKY